MPSAPANRWLPIRPATDSALAMAMLRWIIDNQRYAEPFLTAPHAGAVERAGYRGFATPATWCSATSPTHASARCCGPAILACPLRGGLWGGDAMLVEEASSGEPRPAGQCERANLWVDRLIQGPKGS